MSFTSYPIISYGSNIDILRQGHNFVATNIGDMDGLQTAANVTLVDALNYLNSAFSALTVSAYPPLNNEQWLTATIFSGFGTINLFKLSSTNEFVIGQHMIPLSTLTDLGKVGTAWRNGYITTVNTDRILANTNLDISADTYITLSFDASQIVLTQVSATDLRLETLNETFDIRSLRTRLYSTGNFFELSTTGHWEPGVTQTQNIGSATKEINRVFTKNITASGDVTFNADIIAPNAGLAVPIGGGCLWFLPTPPANYIIADGTAQLRASFPALNTLYQNAGYPYGSGNGTTTFGIPDMRNRIPFGVNTAQTSNPDASVPGRTFGTLNHTHNSVMPRHFHTSVGLVIDNHINQVTGGASNAPGNPSPLSAAFSGNQLPTHIHGVTQTPHGHGVRDGANDTGHGHLMSDPGHIHGAGLTQHRHFLDTGGRAGGNTATDPARWFNGSNGSAQIPLMLDLGVDFNVQTDLNPGGVGVGIDPASVVSQGLTIQFNKSEVAVLGQVANIANNAVDANTAGTPSGSVSLINVSHTHTIPTLTHNITGTVGIVAGGVNGDADQTLVSTVNNPPCFAVHFIIRAR